MKKTISAFIGFSLLTGMIFFACQKNNQSQGVAPTYASQGSSTGNNPNVTTTGSSTTGSSTSGSTTGTSTTGSSTTGSTTGSSTTGGTTTGSCGFTYNGYTVTNGTCADNSVNCPNTASYYAISSSELSSSTVCYIGFSMNCPTTPSPGNYTIVQGPTILSNECMVSFQQGTNFNMAFYATGGTVNVSLVSGKLKYTFTNIPIQDINQVTSTASGTLTQP